MDQDWTDWIERLKAGDLTPEELREFQKSVGEDASCRDAYLNDLLAEVALESSSLPNPLAVAIPARRWPRFVGIAAGIAALAAVSYFMGSRSFSGDSSGFVATITDADESAEKTGLRIGQPVEKGTIVLPDDSEIGIAMRGGARLKIRGPANLEIKGPDKIHVMKGRVSTYAPSYAHGFTVDTVDGQVVDLGTRFVTAVDNDSGTEIHVIEGLVKANADPAKLAFQDLGGENAGILKGGKLEPTEFLAQRLNVPLDPVLKDTDSDGYPDVVEGHFGTSPEDAASQPVALRIEESFGNQVYGPIRNAGTKTAGATPGSSWDGEGQFIAEGLSFEKNGVALATGDGAVRSTGVTHAGATFLPDSRDLSPVGVSYVSFLMKMGSGYQDRCFGGLIFYQDDREELFVGKLSIQDSYGSRMRQSLVQNPFDLPMDGNTHLFVIRIDRTRLVTDIFVDPVPGSPEASATRQFRYHEVPVFDRISIRSGSAEESFPATFDEIRVGLTWQSVVPASN